MDKCIHARSARHSAARHAPDGRRRPVTSWAMCSKTLVWPALTSLSSKFPGIDVTPDYMQDTAKSCAACFLTDRHTWKHFPWKDGWIHENLSGLTKPTVMQATSWIYTHLGALPVFLLPKFFEGHKETSRDSFKSRLCALVNDCHWQYLQDILRVV